MKRAHVLVPGVGGLGCLSSNYICRAGFGTVNLGDGDRVRISDLNRQILYREEDIRKEKVLLAKKRLSEMHGEVTFKTFDIYIK